MSNKVMNERMKIGLEVLLAALGLGILGDAMLRATPWGLNVTVFNFAFVAVLVTLFWRHARSRLTVSTIALLGALSFFASMFTWRDSAELRVADTFAILAVLSVLFLQRLNVTARLAGMAHLVIGFFGAALNALFAPAALLGVDIGWKNLPRDGWRRHAFSVMRGVAIAAPLILIFGGLFVAADAVYAGWVQRIFNVEPDVAFSHVVLFAIFAWLSAGYLRGMFISSDIAASAATVPPAPNVESPTEQKPTEPSESPIGLGERTIFEHLNISDPPDPPTQPTSDTAKTEPKKWDWANLDSAALPAGFTLGAVEIGVILGLMNLLFLSFVVVLVPYLFGGMELIQNTPDFKLADYARRGFGELVAVAGLVLPTLLIAHWLIRKETALATKLFRVLAGIQIALLFVIMASAVQRLVLLTGNLGYGMTTVRLYPLIFMAWLTVVFIWFGATVLRGARQHFAWGALWSAFVILGATHVLNPDEFIVKTNIALMREGREFDADYNSDLSDDALPALYEAFPDLNERDAQSVMYRLAERYCKKRDENDVRSWNLSRSAAWSTLEANHGFVDLLGGCESSGFFHRRNHGSD